MKNIRTTNSKKHPKPAKTDNQVSTPPKLVFLHLLLIAMLYISVVSLLIIIFEYINNLFPDEIFYYYRDSYDAIRSASATLIVAFPVFMLMSWLIAKEFFKYPQERQIRLRKWLIYLTLFIAALTIIIDLIQLIYRFYGGELTLPFSLKVVSILLITVLVFVYYLWDVQRTNFQSRLPKVCAWLSSLAVLALIICGFLIVGTPAQQRIVRFDEQRTNDLQILQNEIVNYWQNKNQLPENLSVLKNTISGFIPPQDPETKADYDYRILTALSFELCAEFKTVHQIPEPRPLCQGECYYPDSFKWQHQQGHQCWELRIDPDLNKKNIKISE